MTSSHFFYFLILFSFALVLLSCTTNNSIGESNLSVAVFSDIHGKYIDFELTEDIDIIIVPGDIAEHFRNNADDKTEMKLVLQELLKYNKDVYLIPGNHDDLDIFREVIVELNNPLLHDMSQRSSLEIENYQFLFLPGYHLESYSSEQAYIYDDEDISKLERIVDDTKVNILVAHGPPRLGDVDKTFSGEFVGDQSLTNFIRKNDIEFGIFGHIHEAVGAVNLEGNNVEENQFSESLFLNSGSVLEWQRNNGEINSNIISLNFIDDRVSYEIIEQ